MEDTKRVLHLENRRELSLNGVNEVISFEAQGVQLNTDLGLLEITGTDLHLDKLDLEHGEIAISGSVISLYYPDGEETKRGLFKRLFS